MQELLILAVSQCFCLSHVLIRALHMCFGTVPNFLGGLTNARRCQTKANPDTPTSTKLETVQDKETQKNPWRCWAGQVLLGLGMSGLVFFSFLGSETICKANPRKVWNCSKAIRKSPDPNIIKTATENLLQLRRSWALELCCGFDPDIDHRQARKHSIHTQLHLPHNVCRAYAASQRPSKCKTRPPSQGIAKQRHSKAKP